VKMWLISENSDLGSDLRQTNFRLLQLRNKAAPGNSESRC
jgi:hypothetical protein